MSNKKIGFISPIHHGSKDIIVSLDLHDHNIYNVTVDVKNGDIHCDKNILGSYPELLKELQQISHLKNRIMVIFEAGSHGFYPCWFFQKHGFDYRMIAPHSIPQKNRQATDRIDTWENLKDYCAGNLRFVNVPNPSVVDARDLLRKRFSVVNQTVKMKNRITAHVKRHGHIYTLGTTKWSKKHRAWISSLPLEPTAQTLLKIELEELAETEERCIEIDVALDNFLQTRPELKKLFDVYTRLRGIGPVCAKILVLEGGDLSRFSHPRKLMSFTGLVPGLSQSGIVATAPSCPITKQGNKYLRYAFVCASKMYLDYRCLYSEKELNKFSQPVATFIKRCQKRLHTRSKVMSSKGKHTNKIRCAVARELCAFVWEYVVKVLPSIDLEPMKHAA
jgi:transposase